MSFLRCKGSSIHQIHLKVCGKVEIHNGKFGKHMFYSSYGKVKSIQNHKALGNVFRNTQQSFHISPRFAATNNRGYQSFSHLNNDICIYGKILGFFFCKSICHCWVWRSRKGMKTLLWVTEALRITWLKALLFITEHLNSATVGLLYLLRCRGTTVFRKLSFIIIWSWTLSFAIKSVFITPEIVANQSFWYSIYIHRLSFMFCRHNLF